MTEKAREILERAINELREENAAQMASNNTDDVGVVDNRRLIRGLYLELMEDEFEKNPINNPDRPKQRRPIGFTQDN